MPASAEAQGSRAACCAGASARVFPERRWDGSRRWLSLAIIKVTLGLAFAQVLLAGRRSEAAFARSARK